ncbi:MAG: hypothetical protein ACE5JI_19100 [Acidobacteriota bacterium]
MTEKPTTASEYTPDMVELARSTVLYVCTKLGDYIDEFVVVGGLVPALIIEQDPPPEGAEKHVGTRDLDIGFSLAILDDKKYQEISARLRRAGFEPDTNEEGNPTFQRWRSTDGLGVTIDFLIPQIEPEDRGGSIKNLEKDFGALITPGLELAFDDRIRVPLSGETILGEEARRDVWVCGPGAYVVLKALAFKLRGENKDAYDLFYVVRNFAGGPRDVARHLTPLLESDAGAQTLEILATDFARPNSLGPVRVALFIFGEQELELQGEATSFIGELIRLCRQ